MPMTPEEAAESELRRIEILRDKYGDEESEVKAWDAAHPRELPDVTSEEITEVAEDLSTHFRSTSSELTEE